MFVDQVYRVMWKEYRAQRTLWCAYLFIGALFCVFNRTGNYHLPLIGSWMGLIALMHAVGCGVLLFANERETGTSNWLIGISVPPSSHLTGKLLFATLSTVLLQLALVLLSIMVFSDAPLRNIKYVISISALTAALTLPWAMLGSLLCERVLLSVAVSFLAWLVVQVIPLSIVSQWRFIGQELLIVAYTAFSTLAVVGFDIWLGWRWCQGKFVGRSALQQMTRGASDWGSWLTFPAFWTARPRLIVDFTDPTRRAWHRLVWYERYRDQHYWALLALGCLGGVTAGNWAFPGSAAPRLFGITFCIVIPALMGTFAFQRDSEVTSTRFFAERGVNPYSLWLAKQFVWLPRALLTTGASLIALQIGQKIRSSGSQFGSSSLWFNDIHWFWPVALILMSFGCGQAWSLIARPLLAAMAAIAMSFSISTRVIWLGNLLAPSWFSLGPTVVALYLFSLWQIRPQLNQAHPRNRNYALIALLIGIEGLLVHFTVLALLPRL